MTVDLTPIIQSVIVLIAAVISAFVIPWIKSKTSEAQRQSMVAWVKIAVAAAEQIFMGTGRGEEKKKYVIDFLKEKGFTLNEDVLDAAIEAAVKQLNSEGIVIS